MLQLKLLNCLGIIWVFNISKFGKELTCWILYFVLCDSPLNKVDHGLPFRCQLLVLNTKYLPGIAVFSLSTWLHQWLDLFEVLCLEEQVFLISLPFMSKLAVHNWVLYHVHRVINRLLLAVYIHLTKGFYLWLIAYGPRALTLCLVINHYWRTSNAVFTVDRSIHIDWVVHYAPCFYLQAVVVVLHYAFHVLTHLDFGKLLRRYRLSPLRIHWFWEFVLLEVLLSWI